MLYRRSTQLAVQAMLLLALEPPGGCRRVRELAAELGVPATYLAKIVQNLAHVGLIRAVRGPGGGVQLVRPPREIPVWNVLAAVEPVGEFERCFLKLDRCNDLHPCPLHECWAPIRSQILAMLQSKNLWEVASEAQRRGVLGPEAGSEVNPAPRQASRLAPSKLEKRRKWKNEPSFTWPAL